MCCVLEGGIRQVEHSVQTEKMMADAFTKPLAKTAFNRCRDYLMTESGKPIDTRDKRAKVHEGRRLYGFQAREAQHTAMMIDVANAFVQFVHNPNYMHVASDLNMNYTH